MTDPDYEFDFSSSTDWIGGDSKNVVNTTTERLYFDIRRDGSNDKIYYDLGSALDNTAWVIRFKCVMLDKEYTGGSNTVGFIGVSSITGGALTTQDFLGHFKATNDDDASSVNDDINLGDSTGGSLGNPDSGTQYHELRRTSATEFVNTVWGSNTFSGTPIATHTITINSSVQGLRYFMIGNYNSGSGSGTLTGYIDDLKIYDGITSVVAIPDQQLRVMFYPDNNVQDIVDDQQLRVMFYPDNNVQDIVSSSAAWKWWLGMRFGTRKRYGSSHVRRMRI